MRAPSRQFPSLLTIPSSGPYRGMVDTTDPSVSPADFARLLRNVYVPDGVPGRRVKKRPGFRIAAGSGAGSAGTPLGSVGARRGQLVYQFAEVDGSTHVVVILGGRFYEWDPVARTISEPVTAANFATATITLSQTARCEAVTLGGKMVVDDGVNTPFMWDGGTGAGSLTKLTNSPPLLSPVVYYAKRTGILATDKTTFVWSEENDPTLGYDTAPYTNAWQFTQTGSDPLTALAATNEALFIYRARSAARVMGAMGPDFQTTGTRTDVDDSHGTTGRVLVTDAGMWSLDADGRPQLIGTGGARVDLWKPAQQTVQLIPRSAIVNAAVVEWAALDAICFGVPDASDTWPSLWLAYRRSDGTLIGRMDGWTANRIGTVLDAEMRPTLMFLGEDDGYAYDIARPEEAVRDDQVVDAGVATLVPIDCEVTGHPWGADLTDEKWWREIDLVLLGTGSANVQLSVATPRGTTSPVAFTAGSESGGIWDVDNWDEFDWAGVAEEARATVGVNTYGRWAVPTVRHSFLGEDFEFGAWAPRVHRLQRHETTP